MLNGIFTNHFTLGRMSIDETDAAREEFYDALRRELYDEHKEEAIAEFTTGRLKSFYLQRPDVMRPAVDAIQEGNWQQTNGRHMRPH